MIYLKREVDEIVELNRVMQTQCFMCQNIIGKMIGRKDIDESEQYHLEVCLPAIKALRDRKEGKTDE